MSADRCESAVLIVLALLSSDTSMAIISLFVGVRGIGVEPVQGCPLMFRGLSRRKNQA